MGWRMGVIVPIVVLFVKTKRKIQIKRNMNIIEPTSRNKRHKNEISRNNFYFNNDNMEINISNDFF